MRILFVGDVVGRAGRAAVSEHLPGMIRDWSLEFVIINGENSAGGFGITEVIYQELLDAGGDAITLGNHAWDQREALVFIERAPKLVRPANFPRGAPGRGSALIDAKNGRRVLVVNAVGRVFMTPFDDPFAIINQELEACPLRQAADAIVIDFHCEASSEKQGIGMQKEEPLRRFTTGIPSGRFEPAGGVATLSGVAVETDDATGLALKIAPVRIGGRLEPAKPAFW